MLVCSSEAVIGTAIRPRAVDGGEGEESIPAIFACAYNWTNSGESSTTPVLR